MAETRDAHRGHPRRAIGGQRPAGQARRARQGLLVAGAEAHGQGVQGGQPHRLGCRAHLLRDPRDLPRAARARLDPRAAGRRHDPVPDRQPRPGRAGAGAGHLHQRDREPAEEPGRGGHHADRRPRCRDLVRVRLRLRVHARLERDLRRRGGAPDLEEPPDARRHDARAAPAARDHRGRRGLHRRPRGAGRQGDRARQERRGRLEHREVAGADRHRQPDVRDPLLRRAEREAPEVPLGQPRRRGGRGPLDPRVGGVRLLRRELQLVQRDLRRASAA